jgi:hypothetical protein
MFLLVKVEMSQYWSLEEAYKIPVAKKVRPEGFQSMKPLDKPYSSQYTDYDYMCKNSGICLTNPKETFSSSSEKPTAPAAASCSPLTAPTYQYPFSEKDKEKFRKALKVALENMENPEPPPLPETTTQQEAAFNGLVDKELEAYMMVNDMKEGVRVTTLPPAGPPPADFSPVVVGVPLESTKTDDVKKQSSTDDVKKQSSTDSKSNFTKKNNKLFDLLLFIIAGILIILIMDQLFKLALIIGMDKTLRTIDSIIQSREIL